MVVCVFHTCLCWDEVYLYVFSWVEYVVYVYFYIWNLFALHLWPWCSYGSPAFEVRTSGVCSGCEQNLTACRLMNCSGTAATAAGVQCSKYWMCSLSRDNRLLLLCKVIIRSVMKVIRHAGVDSRMIILYNAWRNPWLMGETLYWSLLACLIVQNNHPTTTNNKVYEVKNLHFVYKIIMFLFEILQHTILFIL